MDEPTAAVAAPLVNGLRKPRAGGAAIVDVSHFCLGHPLYKQKV